MAFVLADRVQETTPTAGTGPLALAGASPGFRAFGAVMATGDTTRYTVVDDAANAWETGVATFTAGSPSTLSRSPAATSAGGTAPIALAGNPGTRVFIGPDAAYFATLAPLASPVLTAPTLSGTVTLDGLIACTPVVGRKIDIYNSGSTIYGFGLNDFEYCIFGGAGSALTYRIARGGASDLAGDIVLSVNATGLGLPAGNPISWGSNTLLVDAAGALLVNGAPVGAGGSGTYNPASVAITGGTVNGTTLGDAAPAPVTASVLTATERATVGSSALAATAAIYFNAQAGQVKQFVFQSAGSIRWTIGSNNTAEATGNVGSDFVFARWDNTGNWLGNALSITRATGLVLIPNVDLEGGTIDNTAIGNTTPSTLRGTTLALTGSLTSKFVLIAPNAANGAPTWRQILSTDVSGLGTLATANAVSPPPLGTTTAAAGTFTTLAATTAFLRSSATGLTASTTNTQAGALALTAQVNNITTAAANSAVRLPLVTLGTNTAAEIVVRNGGANAVNCFPATSAAINALAANAAYSLAAGASVRFLQLSTTLYVTA